MTYVYEHLLNQLKPTRPNGHAGREPSPPRGRTDRETLPISVCVTTKNNADTIRGCLESVVGWTDEIVVVDSDSDDGTVEICEEYGADVHQHEFESFAQIKGRAMAHADNDWVFVLDADEEVPPTLREEIYARFGASDAVAFYIEKQEHMLGARTNQYHYRRPYLARKDVLYFRQEYIWERLSVERSHLDRTESLSNRIDHYRFDRASELESKTAQYSALEALQTVENGRPDGIVPFLARGLAVGLDRLLISRGVLDGYRGFYVAFLEFYQMVAAYVKVRDIRRLQREHPERWREIWIEEECRR